MKYVLRKARDDETNQTYLVILEEETDGLLIQDIIRGSTSSDDPRIPRYLLSNASAALGDAFDYAINAYHISVKYRTMRQHIYRYPFPAR